MAVKEKKAGKFPIALILLVVVLALGASVGGSIIASKIMTHKQVGEENSKNVTNSKITKDEVIVPMEEFLVNLAKNKDGEQQYVRTKISLLTKTTDDGEELTKNIAVARDSVGNVLRQKKADDILNSPDSVKELKAQLKSTINKEYGSEIVKEVFITDLVIQ